MSTTSHTPRYELPVIGALFFLSGAIGLVYEVVWIKILALQFGHSAWSISTVIAAFMGGLGLGSWWVGERSESLSRPIRTYALIEWGIAIYGLFSGWLLSQSDLLLQPLYLALADHHGVFVLCRFLLASLLLVVPTFLMGASLPVLVVGFSKNRKFSSAIGFFYGINTVGAGAGVVLAGFFLLPKLGNQKTILVSAVAGALVGAFAYYWDRFSAPAPRDSAPPKAPVKAYPWVLLTALFISGGLNIFYEISWTRLLAPVIGSSTYAFSIILATYLFGIGLGSLLLSVSRKTVEYRRSLIGILIALTSLVITANLYLVDFLPHVFHQLAAYSQQQTFLFFLGQAVVAGLLMIGPCLLMGVTLPVAIAVFHHETHQTGSAVGKLYAANTLGSIGGSLAAGFVCLPLLGAWRSILAAGFVGTALGLFLVFAERRSTRQQKLLQGALIAVLGVLIFTTAPQIDDKALQSGQFRNLFMQGPAHTRKADMIFIKDGVSSTVSVFRDESKTIMTVNGKSDASTGLDKETQYLLGYLPLFLNPSAQSACVIGWGSGATVRALNTSPELVTEVVEIEPAAIEAAPFFTSLNDGVWKDPRVKIHIDDGRTFLQYQPRTYDIIVSEPSNPWVAGVGSLFSADFYELASRRLNENGVFCQWIQAYEISSETLNTMLRTLNHRFKYVLVFKYNVDLICVASNVPLTADPEGVERLFQVPAVRKVLNRIQVHNPFDLFVGFMHSLPDDSSFYPSDVINTDDNSWLEFKAPTEMYFNVWPQLQPPAAETALERYRARLFPRLQQPDIAVGLSRSILKVRPAAWPRIQEYRAVLKEGRSAPVLAKLEDEARKKNAYLQDADKKIQAALVNIDRGLTQVAESQLLEILGFQERNLRATRGLATCYFVQKKWNLAIAMFGKALELNPDDYDSLTHAGLATFYLGNKVEGIDMMRNALALNPQYIHGRACLSVLMGREKNEAGQRELQREAARILDQQQLQLLEKEITKVEQNDPLL